MKRLWLVITIIYLLSLFSVGVSASPLQSADSVSELALILREPVPESVISVADICFGEVPSLAIRQGVTLRGEGKEPSVIEDGRFILLGGTGEQMTVWLENLCFKASDDSGLTPAITLKGNVKVVFSNCSFYGYSSKRGAAIFGDYSDGEGKASVSFTNCLFESNVALEGGAVFLRGDGDNLTLSASGCVFNGNVAALGGGSCLMGVKASLGGCTFTANGIEVKNSYGGGIYAENGSLTLTSCALTDNCSGYGGGLGGKDMSLSVSDCVFANNEALSHGGNLWVAEKDIPEEDIFDGEATVAPLTDRYVQCSNTSIYLGTAEVCGGVCLCEYGESASPAFTLCTVVRNEEDLSNHKADWFGCILDGETTVLPHEGNGYCLTLSASEVEEVVSLGDGLLGYGHLNCLSSDSSLRIPIDAVKNRVGDKYSHLYGAFPVGDNYGSATLYFHYYPLRTAVLTLGRGSYIKTLPAPMRDFYSFEGWYLPDGAKLPGAKLLVGGDVREVELTAQWRLNRSFYLTAAGAVILISFCTLGGVIVKKRMKRVDNKS